MDTIAEVAKVLVSSGAPLTRGDIAQRCGRSQAAISGAVEALEIAGLVEIERAALPSSGGRPADRVGLRADRLDVVGLHVNPTTHHDFEVRALRADLRGNIIGGSDHRWPTDSFEAALELLPTIVTELSEKEPSRTLVGLALPGVVAEDAEGRGSVAMFSRHIRRPANVVVDLGLQGWNASALNAQDAAAVGELLKPGCEADSLLYVYWGFGLGSGIAVRSGRGYPRTRSGGEIGHMPVVLDPATGTGMRCYCGSYGCLTAHARVIDTLVDRGYEPRDLAHAMEIASTDPDAREVIEHMAVLVGAAIAGLVNLTAPDEIVIGGPIPAHADWVATAIRSTIGERALAPHRGTPVRSDDHSDESAIRGAIEHVRHRFLSNADRSRLERL